MMFACSRCSGQMVVDFQTPYCPKCERGAQPTVPGWWALTCPPVVSGELCTVLQDEASARKHAKSRRLDVEVVRVRLAASEERPVHWTTVVAPSSNIQGARYASARLYHSDAEAKDQETAYTKCVLVGEK